MPAVLQAFRIAFPTVCLPAPGNTRRVAVRSSGGHVAVILVTRKRSHPATIAYIERRVQEGKTRREANRCLKRYLIQSGERDLRGPLSKQGPRYLRWALVEAATHACTEIGRASCRERV